MMLISKETFSFFLVCIHFLFIGHHAYGEQNKKVIQIHEYSDIAKYYNEANTYLDLSQDSSGEKRKRFAEDAGEKYYKIINLIENTKGYNNLGISSENSKKYYELLTKTYFNLGVSQRLENGPCIAQVPDYVLYYFNKIIDYNPNHPGANLMIGYLFLERASEFGFKPPEYFEYYNKSKRSFEKAFDYGNAEIRSEARIGLSNLERKNEMHLIKDIREDKKYYKDTFSRMPDETDVPSSAIKSEISSEMENVEETVLLDEVYSFARDDNRDGYVNDEVYVKNTENRTIEKIKIKISYSYYSGTEIYCYSDNIKVASIKFKPVGVPGRMEILTTGGRMNIKLNERELIYSSDHCRVYFTPMSANVDTGYTMESFACHIAISQL